MTCWERFGLIGGGVIAGMLLHSLYGANPVLAVNALLLLCAAAMATKPEKPDV